MKIYKCNIKPHKIQTPGAEKKWRAEIICDVEAIDKIEETIERILEENRREKL